MSSERGFKEVSAKCTLSCKLPPSPNLPPCASSGANLLLTKNYSELFFQKLQMSCVIP